MTDEIKFPEEIIAEKFEKGEIDFETAESQLINLAKKLKLDIKEQNDDK